MMASNNDINRLLLFGNILQHFPEFLIQVLPFIADRTIFNAIASCNRDTNEKSKAISPPWPTDYRLPASNGDSMYVWSPDGTRIAYTRYRPEEIITDVITIVDQRHGVIHRINNMHGDGMCFCGLKFSLDGSFLVSAGRDGFVKLWDNNVAENYEQLQEWNIREDFGDNWQPYSIDISACSKYIVVAAYSSYRVVLISVEDGEIITLGQRQDIMKCIVEVMFSVDYRAVFVCFRDRYSTVIKLWRPYQDDTDEDSLITLWEQKNFDPSKIIVSHDKTMIAVQDPCDLNNGWMLSIDNKYSCTVMKLNVPAGDLPVLLQFTHDDECIIYATKNGLKYWSVAERKFTDKKYVSYNEKIMKYPWSVNFSPNNRQFIVQDDIGRRTSLYIKSVF